MRRIISWMLRHVPRPLLQRVSGTGLKLVALFYRGDQVQCPVCNNRFRCFLPFGRIRPRPNALCPSCQSLERHRLIWLYLNRNGLITDGSQVLHIAPEACFISMLEKRLGRGYVTTDMESPLAKVKADIHHLPFSENQFDLVLCNHVLEHVHDDIAAMKEIHRVMKPGATAILQVPFFHPVPDNTMEDSTIVTAQAREAAYGQDDHVRRYGKDYPARIERSGLRAKMVPFTDELTNEEINRFGLARGEILYLGLK